LDGDHPRHANSPSDRRQVGRQNDPQRSLVTNGSKVLAGIDGRLPMQHLPRAAIARAWRKSSAAFGDSDVILSSDLGLLLNSENFGIFGSATATAFWADHPSHLRCG
jgi:hypothetical protein